MHSPFVYTFIRDVLNDNKNYPDYSKAELLREKMKDDNRVLDVEDYGAGSVTGTKKKRTISSIARSAAKPPKYGQLLYRMVRYYKPSTILELGTSLGITSHYLSMAAPESRLITMEGAPSIAAIASGEFLKSGMKQVTLVEGNFDDTLPALLQNEAELDFVFVDGNHRLEPTLRYFEWLLPHAGNDSIFIFDDIHWSAEMEEAWHTIKNHPAVRCSIDLFFIGIVVFRREFHEKQHFTIRF